MRPFRYNCTGSWLKGNTHIHSTCSDGGKTFAEIADLYASADYHFLFRTDHWVSSDVSADTEDYPLLWLDGIEIDGADRTGARYHVVCLGTFTGIDRDMGFVSAIESARQQGGIIILAHPHWMGNSQDDALRWGFHGVETYNHVCHWLNGKGSSGPYWNMMMQRDPETLGLAVDDSHTSDAHPGWNGGWVMVNARETSRDGIMTALREGHFYSSCGPDFHSIDYDGDSVRITTSPVKFIRVVGECWDGNRIGAPDGDLLTEAVMPVSEDWKYTYLEIEDADGHRAWTNALFTEDEHHAR